MEALALAAFYLGVVAYSVAAAFFYADLSRGGAGSSVGRWAPRALAVGAVGHGSHVVAASLLSNVCPVASIHFALSLAAFITVIAYLVLRERAKLDALGVAVAPVALGLLVGAQFVGTRGTDGAVPSGLLAAHVTASILGSGLFLLAGAAGLVYLLQESRLKSRRAALGGSMPPLDALDRAAHRLLLAGFVLLTFGVLTGAVFATHVDVRIAVGAATWTISATVLLLRAVAGWRGRRAAWGTLAGALGVVLVFAAYAFGMTGGA